jgi:hypothetical protein
MYVARSGQATQPLPPVSRDLFLPTDIDGSARRSGHWASTMGSKSLTVGRFLRSERRHFDFRHRRVS